MSCLTICDTLTRFSRIHCSLVEVNQAFIAWSFVVAKISTVSEYFARYSEVLGNGSPGRESKCVRDYNTVV